MFMWALLRFFQLTWKGRWGQRFPLLPLGNRVLHFSLQPPGSALPALALLSLAASVEYTSLCVKGVPVPGTSSV